MRLFEEEDSACPALLEREFHSLHRNVPGLRRAGVDTNTIRQVSALFLFALMLSRGVSGRRSRIALCRLAAHSSFSWRAQKCCVHVKMCETVFNCMSVGMLLSFLQSL